MKAARKKVKERFLWRLYRELSLPEARDALLDHYGPIVGRIAARVRGKTGAPFDELLCAGGKGLWEALGRFDPSNGNGASFPTFASRRIRGEMLDWLRRTGPFTRTRVARSTGFAVMADELRQELGREPHPGEVAEALDVEPDAIADEFDRARLPDFVSLRLDPEEGEAPPVPPEETEKTPEQLALRRDFWEALARLVPEGQERRLFLAYFRDGFTQAAIARAEGVSKSMISMIIKRVVRRLRANGAAIRELL